MENKKSSLVIQDLKALALISLLEMGADIFGFSLEPDKIFIQICRKKIENKFKHHVSNILDLEDLKASINYFKPDIIIHLAAQSLVRRSYRKPLLIGKLI